jgi:phytoene dehydrogenase-like protein
MIWKVTFEVTVARKQRTWKQTVHFIEADNEARAKALAKRTLKRVFPSGRMRCTSALVDRRAEAMRQRQQDEMNGPGHTHRFTLPDRFCRCGVRDPR